MRINNNVASNAALRQLDLTNSGMAGSIGRLSTGLRIVNAGDDPSGLVMSEEMRSHIKGLNSANSNTQNAINLTKTAEGSMEEVQTLLSDLRALAVQSANAAVMDPIQLAANQNQVESALSSVDRIAASTQWGSRKLLDGTAGVRTTITDTGDVANANIGSTFNGLTIAAGPLTIQRTTAATQTSLTTNKTFATAATVVPAGSFVINGTTFTTNGTTNTLSDMATAINAQSNTTGVTASIVTVGANVSLKLTAADYGADYKVDYYDTSGVFSTTPHPAPTVAGVDAVATVTATAIDRLGATVTTTATFTGGKGDKTSGLELSDIDGNKIVLSALGNSSATLATASTVGVVSSGDVQFQVGAFAGQTVKFSMPDVRTRSLGTNASPGKTLADIDLTTASGASSAIAIIDDAITQLAKARGDLGSFQKNILESSSRTLQVHSENVTAAESTIRDADMAAEMTQYTKFQILQQSGTAVLAQANQMPQQILKLLGG